MSPEPGESSDAPSATTTTKDSTTTTASSTSSSSLPTFASATDRNSSTSSENSSVASLNLTTVPRHLGSISGLRSVSGSISGLQGTGSFDEIALTTATVSNTTQQQQAFPSLEFDRRTPTTHYRDDDLPLEDRTIATTPSTISEHCDSTPETVTSPAIATIDMSSSQPPPSSPPPPSSASLMSLSEDSSSNINNNDADVVSLKQRSSSNDSADEELKIAKAMALAVQSNPNLTPEEIRQLMASTQQKQQQQQQSKASAMLIPGRLSQVFHLNSNEIESNINANNSTNSGPSTAGPPLQKAVKANFKNLQESFRVSGLKARERLMDMVGNAKSSDGNDSSSSSTAFNNFTTNFAGGAARPMSPTTTTTTPVDNAQSVPGKRSPFRASMPAIKVGVRSPPNLATSPTASSDAADAVSVASAATSVAAAGTESVVADAPAVAIKSPTSTPAATTAASATTTIPKTYPADGQIRLTTICWKRRSGLGKYSVHSAWERRRIILQGTKISYYVTSSNHGEHLESASSLPSGQSKDTMDDSMDGAGTAPKKTNWFEQATASLVSGGVTNLLVGGDGSNDHSATPRGHLDMIKDGATVSAATGHSGAPTPFAISIKVRGETKWKLCFDLHKTQMEWLAALTDVVVQGSVDAYNAALVDAMNPAHHAMDATSAINTNLIFPSGSPTIYEPPQNKGATATAVGSISTAASAVPGGGHRLWMLENYTIKSQHQLSDDDDADDGGGGDDNNDDEDGDTTRGADEDDLKEGEEDDDEKANESTNEPKAVATEQAIEETERVVTSEEASAVNVVTESIDTAEELVVAGDDDEKDEPLKDLSTLSIPEKNLVHVATVLNASLAIARASSTSLEGFWFVVVFANLALFLCTVEQVQKAKRKKQKKAIVASTNIPLRTATDTSGILSNEVGIVATTENFAPSAAGATVKAAPKSVRSLPTEAQQRPLSSAAVGGFKPIAGTTTVRIENPTDVPMNSVNHIFGGWRAPSGDLLKVRSHGYLTTKKKIPSPGELYKLLNVEIFESPRRFPDMAPRVQLPKIEFDDGDKPKTWHSPDIFVVSFALPTDPPKMTGAEKNDGGGYTVTMYFGMHQDTRDILRRITAEDYDPTQDEPAVDDVQSSKVNAVRLFEEWCRRAPTDPKFQARFKLIPHAHNLKEIGVPGWISKYNGKPLLIKRPGQTGFFFPHPELSCIEFDISLHVFPFVAKKAICYLKENFFRKILVTFGFVIEGRADDELPECVIGLMQLCYPDPIHAIQAKDFFAGTCHRSFD